MKLPCRHILRVRESLGLDLFDEELCDKRWSMSYYKNSQRIFLARQEQDPSPVSVVTVPPPPKRPLSQVCTLIRLEYLCNCLDTLSTSRLQGQLNV